MRAEKYADIYLHVLRFMLQTHLKMADFNHADHILNATAKMCRFLKRTLG